MHQPAQNQALFPAAPAHGEATVEVLVAAPVMGRFSYKAGGLAGLKRGDIVRVPFGARDTLGLVLDEPAELLPEGLDPKKLKPVREVYDAPPLKDEIIRFIEWVARYTCAPPGEVLRMVLRSPAALEPPPEATWLRLADAAIGDSVRLTPARKRVLAAMADGLAHTPAEIADRAGVSPSVVKGLWQAGLFAEEVRRADPVPPRPDLSLPRAQLSEAQSAAAQAICSAVENTGYKGFLLDGVTGSGKTEVYFEAIAETLKAGRQALILLPEIALTQQFLTRFEERFGCRPLEWHSDLTSLTRRQTWRAVAEGTAGVVVGARSALFLPFKELGLIVVDEEHDQSFKQADMLLYNARDMAVVRANFAACPIVLASATPSLESHTNAEMGRLQRLSLPRRHAGAREPDIHLIDMRRAPPEKGQWLAPPLVAALRETLERKEQALLFLNRRGYAPLTLCRVCGHRMMSPHAATWLVEHRFHKRLVCHQTGFSMPKPEECPACGTKDSLTPCGPGVERVEEEARQLFPEARIAVASSDLMHGPAATQAFFDSMRTGEIDILIGTQIVAKGHHFPGLTLVGVVDADLGLNGGDLRAAEKTYQLLHQVGGRAGRAERPGRVFLQTYMPEAPVMQALAARDRDAFLAQEAAAREDAGMPPFGRLAAVILSGPTEAETLSFARALVQTAPASDKVLIYGPAPAPIAMVRGRHRARLLIKAPRSFNLSDYMQAWFALCPPPSRLRVQIDIDPVSFL